MHRRRMTGSVSVRVGRADSDLVAQADRTPLDPLVSRVKQDPAPVQELEAQGPEVALAVLAEAGSADLVEVLAVPADASVPEEVVRAEVGPAGAASAGMPIHLEMPDGIGVVSTTATWRLSWTTPRWMPSLTRLRGKAHPR